MVKHYSFKKIAQVPRNIDRYMYLVRYPGSQSISDVDQWCVVWMVDTVVMVFWWFALPFAFFKDEQIFLE